MEKVDIFFAVLLVIGLISMVKVEFLDVSGNVVNACVDSDGGIEPFIGGNLIGFDDSSKKDTCANETTLYEYYCVGDRSNGLIKQTYCDNGCSTKEGKGVCLEKREDKEGQCDNGCYYRGVCLGIGMRANGLYCNVNERLETQVLSGDACENNFECNTNLCVTGNCISQEIFDKFLNSLNS